MGSRIASMFADAFAAFAEACCARVAGCTVDCDDRSATFGVELEITTYAIQGHMASFASNGSICTC